MRCCCAKGTLLRMTGVALATVLALSACGGAGVATRATVTVTSTVTATASPSLSVTSSPSQTSSPSPSSPAGTSYYLADFNPVQTYGINVDSTPHTVNGVTYDHPVAWSPGFSGNPYWGGMGLVSPVHLADISRRRACGQCAVGRNRHLLCPDGWVVQVAKDHQSWSVGQPESVD